MNEIGDVVLHEYEIAAREVRDVRQFAGQQVVDANHRAVAVEQRFGQMRSDESGRAGDDNSFLHLLVAGAPRPAPRRSLAGPLRPAPLAALCYSRGPFRGPDAAE